MGRIGQHGGAGGRGSVTRCCSWEGVGCPQPAGAVQGIGVCSIGVVGLVVLVVRVAVVLM